MKGLLGCFVLSVMFWRGRADVIVAVTTVDERSSNVTTISENSTTEPTTESLTSTITAASTVSDAPVATNNTETTTEPSTTTTVSFTMTISTAQPTKSVDNSDKEHVEARDATDNSTVLTNTESSLVHEIDRVLFDSDEISARRMDSSSPVWNWDLWCLLQPQQGNCTKREERYFYFAQFDKCTEYKYSGCGGSKNNFNTAIECERRCKGMRRIPTIVSQLPEECKLQSAAGDRCARKPLQRYYYNLATDRCESFEYWGCGGNVNNFNSEDTCNYFCNSELRAEGKDGTGLGGLLFDVNMCSGENSACAQDGKEPLWRFPKNIFSNIKKFFDNIIKKKKKKDTNVNIEINLPDIEIRSREKNSDEKTG